MELDLILVDQALKALAQFDERKAKAVKIKFFGGLTVEQIAALLNVSKQTVDCDWRLAKSMARPRNDARGGPWAR
jgi:DNA-directed RNA polymerase specialized sigma24 family protein